MRHKVRFKNNNNQNKVMTSAFSKNINNVPQRAMSLNPSGRNNPPQGRRRSTIFDDMKEFGKKGTDYLNFNVLRGAT